jgi:hypothetical protein
MLDENEIDGQTCDKFVMELRELDRSSDEVDESEQSPDTLKRGSERSKLGIYGKEEEIQRVESDGEFCDRGSTECENWI